MGILKRKNTKKYRRRIATGVGFTLGLGLVAYGFWGLWQQYHATHAPEVTIPKEIVTHSEDEPDETVPQEACEEYIVGDNEVRKIEIPGINVSGCIQKVGIDQNNAIAVPTNIHLAGWYVGSPVPGQEGNSIIDGHVLGRYDDAIFADLEDIETGDMVRIQFGDKSWKEFEVVDSHDYLEAKASSKLFEQLEDVDSQLTLITCSGNYDSQAQTYNKRLIVRTKLVEG